METDVISNTPTLSPMTPTASPTTPSTSSSSSSSSSTSIWKYIVIVLILALFGFNLFKYAGDFSKFIGQIINNIIDVFKPLLAWFGYGVSETAKKTIDLTATGTTKAVNVTANTLTGGISLLQQGLTKTNNNNNSSAIRPSQNTPMPDDAGSTTQASKANRKAGFCYIGEDRGFRSCISVGEGDTCMSGNIFPTQELCINPNLRSG